MQLSNGDLFQSLKLTEEERDVVTIALLDENESKQQVNEFNLVAKVFSTKAANCKGLRGALLSAWGGSVNHVQVWKLSFNLFQFKFKDDDAIQFVLEGGPWLFDDCLVL